jgi:hypothetical protein
MASWRCAAARPWHPPGSDAPQWVADRARVAELLAAATTDGAAVPPPDDDVLLARLAT